MSDALVSRMEARGVDDARGKVRWLVSSLLESRSLSAADMARGQVPSPAQSARFAEAAARLLRHEPVQYVLGETEFYGLPFSVSPAVLIPRPETETLVETAAAWLAERGGKGLRVLDVGTGSGCIAVTLAKLFPACEVTALDISPAALEVAGRNAHRNGVAVRCLESDLLSAVKGERFDLIASNPPYVASAECDTLSPTVRDFEPRGALDGGPDGLRVISRLAAEAAQGLRLPGALVLETGDGQAESVSRCLQRIQPPPTVAVRCDCAGIPRIVRAVFPADSAGSEPPDSPEPAPPAHAARPGTGRRGCSPS
ncbi:MAG: peptide chain release factor N(5)-glutamine methyltransferase [Kiritimatiellae bacterium]|nr:peptide chain release factor N(5)-glutamine methyltransferase [Kiritimatiellia bacterium]